MNGESAIKNSQGEQRKDPFLIAKGEFKRVNGELYNIYILKGENRIRIKEVKKQNGSGLGENH